MSAGFIQGGRVLAFGGRDFDRVVIGNDLSVVDGIPYIRTNRGDRWVSLAGLTDSEWDPGFERQVLTDEYVLENSEMLWRRR